MNWKQFLESKRSVLEENSPFEVRFVETVFSRVRGLNFSNVKIQTPFTDSLGKRRRIDFTIIEGNSVRIAIEVDGWDKTGRGTGMSKREFEDWSRREADMVGKGWTVLRFANTLVIKDPQNCARNIELVLRRERARAMERGASTLPSKPEPKALDAAELQELERLTRQREEALDHLGEQLRRAEAENRGMQTVVKWSMVVAALAIILVMVERIVPVGGGSADGTDEVAFCPGGTPWEEAVNLVGGVGRVFGPVVGTQFAEESTGRPTFLNIGRAFPDPSRVTVVIWQQNRPRFSEPPEVQFANQDICVQGEVTSFQGSVRLEITRPLDILEVR